jgi:hypothetical protein
MMENQNAHVTGPIDALAMSAVFVNQKKKSEVTAIERKEVVDMVILITHILCII